LRNGLAPKAFEGTTNKIDSHAAIWRVFMGEMVTTNALTMHARFS
jgi:hypothetical protein